MRKDTTATLDTFESAVAMAATAAAQEIVEKLWAELTALDAERQRGLAETNPILRAEARFKALEVEPRILRLKVRIAEAEAALDVAREADHQRLRQAFREKKIPLMKLAVAALRAAQHEMLALQAIETAEHELLGPVDRFAWPSLTQNDTGASFVDEWSARAKDAGLLD